MKKVSERKLGDLISAGPAMRRDFALRGINSVAELAWRDPEVLPRQPLLSGLPSPTRV